MATGCSRVTPATSAATRLPTASQTPVAPSADGVTPIRAARAAATGTRVRIRGVVTIPTGLLDEQTAVVQDGTGAILLRLGGDAGRLRLGQRVEVDGQSFDVRRHGIAASHGAGSFAWDGFGAGRTRDPNRRRRRRPRRHCWSSFAARSSNRPDGGRVERSRSRSTTAAGQCASVSRAPCAPTAIPSALAPGSRCAEWSARRPAVRSRTRDTESGLAPNRRCGSPRRSPVEASRPAARRPARAAQGRAVHTPVRPARWMTSGPRISHDFGSARPSLSVRGRRCGVGGLLWDGARLVAVHPSSSSLVARLTRERRPPFALDLGGLQAAGSDAVIGVPMVRLGSAAGQTTPLDAAPAAPRADARRRSTGLGLGRRSAVGAGHTSRAHGRWRTGRPPRPLRGRRPASARWHGGGDGRRHRGSAAAARPLRRHAHGPERGRRRHGGRQLDGSPEAPRSAIGNGRPGCGVGRPTTDRRGPSPGGGGRPRGRRGRWTATPTGRRAA